MSEIKIPDNIFFDLFQKTEDSMPKYSASILNMVNTICQATRPKNVGNLSEIIKEFNGKTLIEWKNFYTKKFPKNIENAILKIKTKLKEMDLTPNYITDEVIRFWVEDLIFIKTFRGFYIENLIFEHLSTLHGKKYIKSSSTDESKGVDGFLDGKPYNVKPITHQNKKSSSNFVNCDIIYYSVEKNYIKIEIKL